MKGIVTLLNPTRGLAAVETDSGFTVFEILEVSCSIELGDEVCGDLESQGGEILNNITKTETMDVFIEGVMCSKENAISLMR